MLRMLIKILHEGRMYYIIHALVGPNYVEIDIDVDINQIMLAGRVASQAGCMSC